VDRGTGDDSNTVKPRKRTAGSRLVMADPMPLRRPLESIADQEGLC
jgi:hypothetical protein